MGNESQTRARTAYLENKRGFGCRRCRHYAFDEPKCEEVSGNIAFTGCCNFWGSQKRRALMTDSQLIQLRSAEDHRPSELTANRR